MTAQFDVIIIGAGIAGVSLAAELAPELSVVVLEMEAAPAYHATGRSAAYFAPSYGNEVIRALTAASTPTYQNPEPLFANEVLNPRPALFVGRYDQSASIKAMLSEQPKLQQLDAVSMQSLCPILNDHISVGLLDSTGGDLDVDAIMQGYLRKVRSHQGVIATENQVLELNFDQQWVVQTQQETYQAPIVVNAAGAWADTVAELAGIEPVGLVPKRRTAILVDPPLDVDVTAWPLVVDVDEAFYFKPEAGKLLLSPADETPFTPTDVHPDEFDIALAVDRVCSAAHLDVKKINHRWAGLRTFAEDKSPVLGFDARSDGFFWLAGQGGYGVQTAPGAAQLARQILLKETLTTGMATLRDQVSPTRFSRQS